ncbi:MAG: 2-C-methyl-D-erythritol 4-phosphate cytidylyltransferase, partial [Planctomycetes bacterium]|nr:2-C-methyl-D-erythritol 4-phosphate cytidylyltransferase [Planctomycetota bacterium]
MARFAVIIPAAGKGERFGGHEKKTFAKLGGKPLFIQTIQLFINRYDVCQTILAIAP